MMGIKIHGRSAFFLLFASLIQISFSGFCASPNAPANLRILDNYEQLGVDTSNPTFAWFVNDSDRGEKQTAYQVIVASVQSNIDSNTGDVWNSGKISSADQYGVKYGGTALQSNKKYWWKVMTWDKDGNPSSWSAGASFITGFINGSGWTASWIKGNSSSSGVPALFRKQFSISKTVSRAYVYISGIGQFELSLNGAKVGDHEMDPGWTACEKTIQYVTLDVTDRIVNGNNAIGVTLADGFLDPSNTNSRYAKETTSHGAKCMIMELIIQYLDGTTDKIQSDTSWKTSTGPISWSNIYGGEDYDARNEKSGWNNAGYGDSIWANAVTANTPGGVLKPQNQPSLKIIKTYTTVSVSEPVSGTIVYDLGYNFAGFIEVSVSGSAGATIAMYPSDQLSNGTVNQTSMGSPQYCKYTLKGSSTEVWRPKFYYTGFRYVQIVGASRIQGGANPYISDVKGYQLCSSAKQIGSFSCSSDTYNKILNMCLQSMKSNFQSIITDCPHREKMGWLEVPQLMAPSFAYNWDIEALFSKVSSDTTDSQVSTGMVPDIAPEVTVFTGGYRDSISWGSFAIRGPWWVYQLYGDTAILASQYNTAKKYIQYLGSKASNNLIGYGLGDWGTIEGCDVTRVESCQYYENAVTMQQWAAALGNTADANTYAALANNIRTAYNNSYWNGSTHNYGTGQTCNAMPLFLGMTPSGEENNVLNALVADVSTAHGNHIQTGEIGHRYVLQALSKYGMADVVNAMITNPTQPGFGYWASIGKTSTPEYWDGTGSQQHCMMDHVVEWLYNTVAGIEQTKPGYTEIRIKPAITGSLASAMASVETIRGSVSSSWNANSDTLNVTVPVNCTAIVYMPTFNLSNVSITEGSTTIWENGGVSGSAAGVGYNSSVTGYVVWNVGSGAYNFTAYNGGSAPTPTPVAGLLGDVNNSGTVDIIDALLVAQYYVGLNPSGFNASNADVNKDGSIDIIDALLVAQYYVGLIKSF